VLESSHPDLKKQPFNGPQASPARAVPPQNQRIQPTARIRLSCCLRITSEDLRCISSRVVPSLQSPRTRYF